MLISMLSHCFLKLVNGFRLLLTLSHCFSCWSTVFGCVPCYPIVFPVGQQFCSLFHVIPLLFKLANGVRLHFSCYPIVFPIGRRCSVLFLPHLGQKGLGGRAQSPIARSQTDGAAGVQTPRTSARSQADGAAGVQTPRAQDTSAQHRCTLPRKKRSRRLMQPPCPQDAQKSDGACSHFQSLSNPFQTSPSRRNWSTPRTIP